MQFGIQHCRDHAEVAGNQDASINDRDRLESAEAERRTITLSGLQDRLKVMHRMPHNDKRRPRADVTGFVIDGRVGGSVPCRG